MLKKKLFSFLLILFLVVSILPFSFIPPVFATGSKEGYIYVVGKEDHSLTAFDISDPTSIVHLDAIEGTGSPNYLEGAIAVDISGDYAYVVSYTDDSLSIFDISNSSDITLAGVIRGAGADYYLDGATNVDVVGNFAYVVSRLDDALTIFNVTDPASISHLGEIHGTGDPNYLDGASGIDVIGNYAYVVSSVDEQLTIFDISDPTDISHVGASVGEKAEEAVIVVGGYAYAVGGGTFTIFDVTDPENPVSTDTITGTGSPNYLDDARDVDIEGDYAYVVSSEDDSLSIFDISNPDAISLVSVLHENDILYYLDGASSIEVVGNFAYVASYYDDALTIFDISDPSDPEHAGEIRGTGADYYLNGAIGLAMEEIVSNVGVTILNLEGCGPWIFAEEIYYQFQAIYSHENATGNATEYFDTVKIAFSDGFNWMNASYDVVENKFSLDDGTDQIVLKVGSVTESATFLTVVFEIYLKTKILDVLDVDIYMWNNDTAGVINGWDLIAYNYFNIYNLGGQGEMETSGTAGREEGGDIFNLYAMNNSWAQANMTYRKLAHIKLLAKMNWTHLEAPFGAYEWTFGFSYCLKGSDEWIYGHRVLIQLVEYYKNDSHRFAKWWIAGYNEENNLVGDKYIYTYADFDELTADLWIDLWFNKINASSTFGVRVSGYYFGMSTSDDWWWKLIYGGTWGPVETDNSHAIIFGDLHDDSHNVIYAPQINLMKVWAKVNRGVHADPSEMGIIELKVFDLTFATGEMKGIQTPPFTETLVPTVGAGGIFGVLFSSISWMTNAIVNALGPGILNSWTVLVGFLDTLSGYFGYPTFFSDVLSLISTLGKTFTASINYMIAIVEPIFLVMSVGITFVLGMLLSVINTLIALGTIMADIITGVSDYTTGFGDLMALFDNLGPEFWLNFIPLILVIYWFDSIDKRSERQGGWMQIFFGDLNSIMSVLSFAFDMVYKSLTLFMQGLFWVIDAIPIL
ncbi:hypothetical protein ES702_04123 [subsurface metagenome]